MTIFNVTVWRSLSTGRWNLSVECSSPDWGFIHKCERTDRDYATAADAITSARHVVREYEKSQEKEGGAR